MNEKRAAYTTVRALKAEKAGVMSTWMTLKSAVEQIDLDIAKNVNGNNEAGIRARHGIRCIKECSGFILSMTLRRDKARTRARHEKRLAKKKLDS